MVIMVILLQKNLVFTLATFEVIQIQFFSALPKMFILGAGMTFQFLSDAKDLKFHYFQFP